MNSVLQKQCRKISFREPRNIYYFLGSLNTKTFLFLKKESLNPALKDGAWMNNNSSEQVNR